MRLRVKSECLAAFLYLGWRCTEVDEGTCVVEHCEGAPLPCRECREPISFERFVAYAGECDSCFSVEVLH